MLVTDLETYCRQRYNAVNDTRFFTSDELYSHIWAAEMQLAKETQCIRSVFSTVSVAAQSEYAFPTNTLAIKRLSYDGMKVEPRALDEIQNQLATAAAPSGRPYMYAMFNEVLYFAPTPDVAGLTIKVFSINEPTQVTAASTLDVPTRYHLDLVEFVIWQMCLKDKNYQGAMLHQKIWEDTVKKAKAWERKMLRGDQMSFVRDTDRDMETWVLAR